MDLKINTKMLQLLAVISLAAGAITGCASSTGHLPVYDGKLDEQSHTPQAISIQYLGVGGYLFQHGEDSIMTAPSFTNPGLMRVTLPLPIAVDEVVVDSLLPDKAKDAEMILVGHAHYDHLLDVPYIMNQHMPETVAYGSTTMKNIVTAAVDDNRLVDITEAAAIDGKAGEWLYNKNKTIRFMPIKAEHAPHVMGIKVMSGHYDKPLETLPTTAYGWKEGQTYAYIIDFLDQEQNPVYRIHYQDAASNSPAGLMPAMADDKIVDMTILCTAAYHQVDDYPEAILQQVQPKTVVLGHWEDFFANQGSEAEVVRMTDIDNFIQRIERVIPAQSQWILPAPFSVMTLEY